MKRIDESINKQTKKNEENMRDPNRIDIVLEAVRIVWKKAPDLRLGQLISNISYEVGYSDPFFLEDDRLLQVLTEKK